MNEKILKALIRLFAIIANVTVDGVSDKSLTIVSNYLNNLLNKELADDYLNLFYDYIKEHHKDVLDPNKKKKKRSAFNSIKVLSICNEINEELEQHQKMFVLIQLLEFIKYGQAITDDEIDFVKTVADMFRVSNEEYSNLQNFIIDNDKEVTYKDKLLVISGFVDQQNQSNRYIYADKFCGSVYILHIESTNTYLLNYFGDDNIYMNSQRVVPEKIYVIDQGATIRGKRLKSIFYSDISGKFLNDSFKQKIILTAKDVEFKFRNSDNGIHQFNFSEETGKLVGIMGGSGAGKSTLMNILNGSFQPTSGNVYINGYDIYKERNKIQGVIGYVPQDDMLLEDLTVYQNLFYNARLCFGNMDDKQIHSKVIKTLYNLDLIDVRNLKVGNSINKYISGGQRKRLNIALELIREPAILFADEPTSGLSSMDSEMVIDLLKEQANKGKLVLINIHQPSSDLYKLFDKIIFLDKGGFPIYYGNPIEAVSYFKKLSNFANYDENQCLTCGNVNSEQILEIIETKIVNEYGKPTKNRKKTPKEWWGFYKENIDKHIVKNTSKLKIPESNFKMPRYYKQLSTFITRDVLSKYSNKQYLLISLLETPLLAIILGYFTKYISGDVNDPNLYVFAENENLPAYLFMSVIVALFIGMSISAEEIIKDKKILKRESYLHLSYKAYLNSKIIILFALSAFQTFSFVLIGNYILEIKDMNFYYWILLFTTSCFANMLGLNISASLNSVITIYILIPFILVPQLLFSGVIVKYDKLHSSIKSDKYVPFIGDIMTSRWAYEALAVKQFKDNGFQKNFFDIEKKLSINSYNANFLLPQLITKTEYIYANKTNDNIWKNEILKELNKITPFSKTYNISFFNDYDNSISELNNIRDYYNKEYNKNNKEKDYIYNQLINKLQKNNSDFSKLKNTYYNNSIADLVLNKNEIDKIKETSEGFIQLKDPVYKTPDSKYGRAHFYSSVKRFGNLEIDTFIFNLMFIWLTTLLLYITLCFDIFNKISKKINQI
ncbi:MAG: hypothetical protein A2X02_05150 [Bacteroidetes bacterium GWF2_29_10]|nr:MAG: hypothetical protein A2X02_05150 [Bacteroidetes bacterium GWF2_29_10]